MMAVLSALIAERARDPKAGSYTNRLLADRAYAIAKVVEEAEETRVELAKDDATVDPELIANEAADLLFHLLVAMRTHGVGWEAVAAVLAQRFGQPARHSTYASPEATTAPEDVTKTES